MTSTVAQAVIATVISEWADQSKPFTAYDVSREVQQRMKVSGHPIERHKNMRDYIHSCSVINDITQYDDYTKTLIDIPGGNSKQAFLYHPISFDPSQYVPTSPPKMPLALAAPATSNSDEDHTLDNRGRLMVPVKFLREIGASAGNSVYVIPENGSLFIAQNDCSAASFRVKLVERNGDIRISGKDLNDAGLTGTKFDITTEDRHNEKVIVVKPVP